MTGGTRPPGQEEAPADRASVVSFVLVWEGDDRKIAAFQNTRARGLPEELIKVIRRIGGRLLPHGRGQ